MTEQLRDALIKRQQLIMLTKLSNTAVFEKLNPKSQYYDPSFPARIYLSPRTVRWRLGEVLDWIASRPRTRARVTSHSNVIVANDAPVNVNEIGVCDEAESI